LGCNFARRSILINKDVTMKRLTLALLLLLLATPAFAEYAPPDEELWTAMAKAFDEMPASKTVHAQIDNIMGQVQLAAKQRAAAKAAEEKAKEAPK